MGYSKDDSLVRVDFFRKDSKKWYTTEAVKWLTYLSEPDGRTTILIHEAFKQSLRAHFQHGARLGRCFAVCLEPYHEHAHPIIAEDW